MKCPSCKKTLAQVSAEAIEIIPRGIGFKFKARGVAYSCALCQAVLSVQADPFALQPALLSELQKRT